MKRPYDLSAGCTSRQSKSTPTHYLTTRAALFLSVSSYHTSIIFDTVPGGWAVLPSAVTIQRGRRRVTIQRLPIKPDIKHIKQPEES